MYRKLALASLALALVAAGACAKRADDVTVLTGGAAVAALRAAPDAAVAAGSGRFEMTVSMDTPDGAFEMVGTGGFTGDQMRMEVDLGSMLADAAQASGETVPDGFDQPMVIVVDGTTIYMRLPMLAGVTGNTGWISMTPDDLGLSGSFGLGGGTNDPSQLLETLRGVTDDVEEVGTDDVRGVATTHFRATIDMARALDGVAPDQRALLESQLEGLGGALSAVPVDVWVDRDGLARRMTLDMGNMFGAGGGGGTASVTVDFFDYGEPVEVVVPDASEVTSFTDEATSFGGVS